MQHVLHTRPLGRLTSQASTEYVCTHTFDGLDLLRTVVIMSDQSRESRPYVEAGGAIFGRWPPLTGPPCHVCGACLTDEMLLFPDPSSSFNLGESLRPAVDGRGERKQDSC